MGTGGVYQGSRLVPAKSTITGGIMVWHGKEADPRLDPAATDVLAAYDAAWDTRHSTAQCYRAGVVAWCRAHPDQNPTYAARQAVAVILSAKASLRIEDA